MATKTAAPQTAAATALLLSIHPQHANRIFEGSKHFELRKVLPKVRIGRIFLYETGGSGIVGWFDVAEVLRKPIDKLWATVGTAATTREAFYAYFASVSQGYAIGIKEAHRFKSPLTADRLNGERLRLLPPQSFMLLDAGQPLRTLLEAHRKATLLEDIPRVTLGKIKARERTKYKELVLRHISEKYHDIDEEFVDATLRTHDRGFDPAGFFTTSKEVLSIYNQRRALIGFTTLTYKSGGCIKSGPTALFSRYRGKGFGQGARKAVEDRALRLGMRKIYCTCPESSEATLRYLLSSGMRVEAHLERHYATTHNELVLGKLIVSDENSVQPVPAFRRISGTIADPTSFDRAVLARAVRSMFESAWSPVSDQFVGRLLRESLELKKARYHEKPKRLVCLQSGTSCSAAVVLLPKRGGAVKGLLLRSTDHEASLRKLCGQALEEVVRLNGRKLYFLHPVADSNAIVFLKSNGFRVEGLLRAPYVPGQDVIVMSRFV